jgi:nucleoside-triphosphatase THEP1
MIYIVSGEIDRGKTQKIESLYRQREQGGGFVSRKIFEGTALRGYEIVDLTTGRRLPLALKTEVLPDNWDEACRCGPFSFSLKAIAMAEKIVDGIIADSVEPVFIDEVGPLELRGRGFALLLKRVLDTDKEIYLTVRRTCLTPIVRSFNIRNYELIELEKSDAKKNSIHSK